MKIQRFFAGVLAGTLMLTSFTNNALAATADDATDPATATGYSIVSGAESGAPAAYYNAGQNKLILTSGNISHTLDSLFKNATSGGAELPLNAVTNITVKGPIDLAGSVFANSSETTTTDHLSNLTHIQLNNGVTIGATSNIAQAMFANKTKLASVNATQTGLPLPASIKQMFTGDVALIEIPQFNYAAVTDATSAFQHTALSSLDLSTMTAVTADTDMLLKTQALNQIKFGKIPSATSGWTGRWTNAENNDAITADNTKKALAWIGSSMDLSKTYKRLTTDAQYTKAGLSNMYHIDGLHKDNAYKISDGSANPFTTYCLNWKKDGPKDSFYTGSGVTDSTSWASLLDDDSASDVTRTLTNYDNSEQKAFQTILFFGYPNDGAGLLDNKNTAAAKTDLYAATQAVLWSVLNGIGKTQALEKAGSNSTQAQNLYDALLSKTYANFTGSISDGTFNMTVYQPDDATRQNMISGTYSVSVTKYAPVGTVKLPGAKLVLSTDAAHNNKVAEWTTTDKTHVVVGLIPGKEYYLTELAAPAGYDIATQIKFTANGHHQRVDMTDTYKKHSITVKKVDDSQAQTRVVGAALTLSGTRDNGTIITSQTKTTTSSDDLVFTDLYPGTYTISETSVPAGYQRANDISFTIAATDEDSVKHIYTMIDKKVKYGSASITKVDPKGENLSGAEFKVTDSTGKIVTTFTSSSSAQNIANLTAGETYTLEETKAPTGYQKAEKKTFTVTENSTTEIKITDQYSKHELTIKKVDNDGNRVANAELKISGTTLAGDTIDSITFTTKSDSDKTVELYPGSYTISETSVPDGYTKASDQKVTIKLTDDSKTVTLVDKKTAEKETKETKANNTINIYKYITGTTTPVKGAVLAIYNGETEIAKFTTTDKPYTITTLTKNTTYTLKELTVPEGYKKAEDMTFTVSGQSQNIVMYDAPTTAITTAAPKTGDSRPIGLLIAVIVASVIGAILGLFLFRRIKSQK